MKVYLISLLAISILSCNRTASNSKEMTDYGAVIYKGYNIDQNLHEPYVLSYINKTGIWTIRKRELWLKANVGDSIQIYFDEDFGLNFHNLEVVGKSEGNYDQIDIYSRMRSSSSHSPMISPIHAVPRIK